MAWWSAPATFAKWALAAVVVHELGHSRGDPRALRVDRHGPYSTKSGPHDHRVLNPLTVGILAVGAVRAVKRLRE